MCRFAKYKGKYACFRCRKAFRYHQRTTCPECGDELIGMGVDFKVPPQSNTRQWRKVQILREEGIVFGTCGCSRPGYRPYHLTQVDDFLETYHIKKMLDPYPPATYENRKFRVQMMLNAPDKPHVSRRKRRKERLKKGKL